VDNSSRDFCTKLNSYQSKECLVFDDVTYSYEQLCCKVNEYEAQIVKEIINPTVVVLRSDYSFESISLFLALHNLKFIIVPVVTDVDSEVSDRMEVSNADYMINISPTGELIIQLLANNHEQHHMVQSLLSKTVSGLVLFSSGSTGKPKAMIHNLDNLVNSFLDKKLKKMSIMVFLMFDHIGGINTLLNSLASGALIVIPSNRKPEHVANLIEKYKVNILPSSPTFLNLMLMAKVNETFNLKSLRMITYGTEAMPASLLLKLKGSFGRCKFLQTFGTSETGIIRTSSRASGSLDIKLDDPSQEFKVVDNELWLRSSTQVMGYLNSSMDAFTEDGWFKTGDVVEDKGNGFIRIVGRTKEVINVGGEKVLPAEVESVLLEIPEVLDSLVKGIPSSITGQTVFAQVVVNEGVDLKEAKKIIKKYCRENLARFKQPTKIEIVEKTEYSQRFKKMRI
jgi:acyl-coenzyme A synthetase/AMP-(fatty) acid ligase